MAALVEQSQDNQRRPYAAAMDLLGMAVVAWVSVERPRTQVEAVHAWHQPIQAAEDASGAADREEQNPKAASYHEEEILEAS